MTKYCLDQRRQRTSQQFKSDYLWKKENLLYTEKYWNNIALIEMALFILEPRSGYSSEWTTALLEIWEDKSSVVLRKKITLCQLATLSSFEPRIFCASCHVRVPPPTLTGLDSGLWTDPENCSMWSRLSRSQNITYKNSHEHSPHLIQIEKTLQIIL